MQNKYFTPIAIVVAGAFIAVAVFFSGSASFVKGNSDAKNIIADALEKPTAPEPIIAPVTSVDHVRGNREAKVTIIEYSDTECPFCKRFHESLIDIMKEYESTGNVAWVYRHFPLDFHKKAAKEAEALECAGEVGGNDGFWKYSDIIYAKTPSNDGLDLALLPVFADEIGIDKAKFTTCLNSGKYAAKIQEAKAEGYKAGARGTPYTVFAIKTSKGIEYVPLVDKDGNGLGALPGSAIKNIIEKFLNS